MNDTIMDEVLLKLEQTGNESEEELENITRTLVNELKQVEGIHNVSYASKQEKMPEGARAGEVINLGEIVFFLFWLTILLLHARFLVTFLSTRRCSLKICLLFPVIGRTRLKAFAA